EVTAVEVARLTVTPFVRVKTDESTLPLAHTSLSNSWKFAFWVPSAVGAVIGKVSVYMPALEWSAVLKQLVVRFIGTEGVISHPVPFQVPPVRVPVTAAVMEAPGSTVTELP